MPCFTLEDIVSIFQRLEIKNKVDITHAFLNFVSDPNVGAGRLKRTERVSENEASPGPDLPYPVDNHCIVKLSVDTFYLIGGNTDK